MKIKTFRGGYKFKNFEGQPEDRIVSSGIPSKIIIPLAQGFGSSLNPLVREGEQVVAGQIIARDDEQISSPIHSSIAGKVIEIKKYNYFNKEVTAVVIEKVKEEEDETYQKIDGHTADWHNLPSLKLEELIYQSGVSSLDREGIPTRFKSSLIDPDEVEDLIIDEVGSEAYNISTILLLEGKGIFNFVEGIKILQKIMPQANFHLALNKDHQDIIEKTTKLTSSLDKFSVHPLVAKYPQGYDEVLIPTILGKKFPYGYLAANIGVVVLNIQAVIQVFEAVVQGKPLIERIIALCGPAFKENVHIKTRVGTPLEFLLKDRLKEIPTRIFLSSLLFERKCEELSLPISRTFSQLIAIEEDNERKLFAFLRPGFKSDSYSNSFISDLLGTKKTVGTNLYGEQRPCIQCGYCAEACPVKIIPHLLYRYANKSANEITLKYGIFNCIDCNLCSYVCPCKIPVAKTIKEGKTKLIELGGDHSLYRAPKFDLKGLKDYKGVKSIR